MFKFLLSLAEVADTPVPTFSEIITPYMPLIVAAAGVILGGIFTAYNRRKGNVETRAPDVNELWHQQAFQAKELDKEYRWRRRLQNYVDELLRVFRAYVARVQSGGSVDLTHHEKLMLNSDPPTSEITSTKEEGV